MHALGGPIARNSTDFPGSAWHVYNKRTSIAPATLLVN
jgi:hypothetical protein